MAWIHLFIAFTLTFNMAFASAPLSGKSTPEIEAAYQQCVKAHKATLDPGDQSRLQRFERDVRGLQNLRPTSATNHQERREILFDEANHFTRTRPYLALRMFRLLAQDRLVELVEKTVGPRFAPWPSIAASFRQPILRESPQVLEEQFARLKLGIAQFYDRQNIADLEKTKIIASQTIELVASDLLQTQRESQALSEERNTYRLRLLRQGALALAGASALLLAFRYGPRLVGIGEKFGRAAGYELLGELAAVATVGGIGGGGATAMERAYAVSSSAGVASLERKTPYSCELKRLVSQEGKTDFLDIAIGVGFGITAGTVLSAIAAYSARAAQAVLFVVGASVGIAFAFEGTMGIVKSVQFFHLLYLAQEHAALGTAEDAALALHEAHLHAQEAGAHFVDAAIVGILFRSLWMEGEFRHAMKSGFDEILKVLAISSDEMAPTAKAAAKVAGSAASLVGDAADESASVAKMLALKLSSLKAAAVAGTQIGTKAPLFHEKLERQKDRDFMPHPLSELGEKPLRF